MPATWLRHARPGSKAVGNFQLPIGLLNRSALIVRDLGPFTLVGASVRGARFELAFSLSERGVLPLDDPRMRSLISFCL